MSTQLSRPSAWTFEAKAKATGPEAKAKAKAKAIKFGLEAPRGASRTTSLEISSKVEDRTDGILFIQDAVSYVKVCVRQC